MQQGDSEERINSANASSSNLPHKSSATIFGFLSRRFAKVEPHPVNDINDHHHSSNSSCLHSMSPSDHHHHDQAPIPKEHDTSFAKCSGEKNVSVHPLMSSSNKCAAASSNVAATNVQRSKNAAQQQAKSQTMPQTASVTSNNLQKLYGAEVKEMLRRRKSPLSKSNIHLHRHSTDGSQSDGAEIVVQKSPGKYHSTNYNRFSHQFGLCCKTERRRQHQQQQHQQQEQQHQQQQQQQHQQQQQQQQPFTSPVTVRYNSIVDTTQCVKRDNFSLSWSMTDRASLSLNSSEIISAMSELPTVAMELSSDRLAHECSSAPQSPISGKSPFTADNTSHSSPSKASVKSAQCVHSDAAAVAASAAAFAITNDWKAGPIHPIAVAACRSRLRLKLMPPGMEMATELKPFDESVSNATAVVPFTKDSTLQHMSSPNIAIRPEVVIENVDVDMRFLSHENIPTLRPSPSDGLVKHAMMAAQVLSLIPTEKARSRSFLDGHLGSSSLMGPGELSRILPSKEITIFVGTWNMNGQSPPKQLNDFVLPTTIEHVPDIVAIGTQESSPDRFEWEVTIQETLGPSHVLFHSTALGTLHLAVYMRRDLIWYCSAPEDASMSVRTGSAFRTKGAVAISFCLFGTSILFVTSHLTAHQQKVKERVSDVKRIIHALDLPKNLHIRNKNKDVTQNFDNVFWCGDLNFRLSEPREKLLEWIQNTRFPLASHLPHGYMHTDQLSSVLADGAAFRGFMEANITFPPTYKYDPGTQHFDTSSKQRAPAYTDRILYKYRPTQGFVMRRQSSTGVSTTTESCIQCLIYDSVPSIITSDHKPVLAVFKIAIRPGTDSIPLSAGLFNRDIYLEGMKRRLSNQYTGSSTLCSIQ